MPDWKYGDDGTATSKAQSKAYWIKHRIQIYLLEYTGVKPLIPPTHTVLPAVA